MRFIFLTIILFFVDLLALRFFMIAPAEYLEKYDECHVKAIGYIEPLSVQDNEQRRSFILCCEQVSVENKTVKYRDKLRIYLATNKQNEKIDLKSIDSKTSNFLPTFGKVMVQGKLHKLHNFANPGAYSMEDYNWVQGIGGMVKGNEFMVLDTKPRFLDNFALVNIKLKTQIKKLLSKETANILIGMVLGGSGDISIETRESFAANGLSHLLSVSGTHLLLLAAFLQLLLKGLKKNWHNMILLFLLGVYACICGLRPPVVRAWTMTAMLLWGDGERASKGNILCLICIIFIICNPVCILDLGFQLSFGATAGLLWLLEPLKSKLGKILEFSNTVRDSVSITLAAQLATLPVLVSNFYVIPIISVFSNLLLVPILEIATILTVLGMLMSFLFVSLGQFSLNLAGWLVEHTLVLAAILKEVPFGNLTVGELPLFCGILYYAVLFSWLDLGVFITFNKVHKNIIIGIGSSVIVCCLIFKQYLSGPLTLYFVDVGQGDSTVIITPHKKVALIDTGGLKNYDTGARILVPLLRSQGIRKIDALFISHGDFDHIGGGEGLARNISIENIILPQERFREDELLTINKMLSYSSKSKIIYANKGQNYELGGAIFKIIAALDGEGNDGSSVIEVEDLRNKYKVLFTGDISIKGEQKLGALEKYDILKVAHHGAKSSSSSDFLEQVCPKLAVISCGYKNIYKHPHKDTLARLNYVGSKVLRTDYSGCIQVQLGKEGIKVKRWRKAKT